MRSPRRQLSDRPARRRKFENLNRSWSEAPTEDADWIVVIDDDVEFPHGFLDRFLFLADRFGWTSSSRHCATPATPRGASAGASAGASRERPGWSRSARCWRFTARSPGTSSPFPPLRMGWGLDLHWGALARERGWRLGVIDATPSATRRASRRPTTTGAAVEELRGFLCAEGLTSTARPPSGARAPPHLALS